MKEYINLQKRRSINLSVTGHKQKLMQNLVKGSFRPQTSSQGCLENKVKAYLENVHFHWL